MCTKRKPALRDDVTSRQQPTPPAPSGPAVVPSTEEEIQHAAGAIRDVAHAFLKALTPTPDCQENQGGGKPVPEGVFKNVKDALQKLEEIAPSPITVQQDKVPEQNGVDVDPSIRNMAGKGVAASTEDEDVSEVGEAEVSCGIDLPTAQDCSGNVTPVPTTGELEDISEVQDQSTATANQTDELVLKASL